MRQKRDHKEGSAQKYRRSSDLVRLRNASERDRASHLDDFRLAAAIPRLGRVERPDEIEQKKVKPLAVDSLGLQFPGIM
jgi:hypothetical protein